MAFRTAIGRFVGLVLLSAYLAAYSFFRATDFIEVWAMEGALPLLTSAVAAACLVRLLGSNLGFPLAAAAIAYYIDSVALKPLDEAMVLRSGSVVLVTGANSGVGLAAASALAQLGASIMVLGCRSAGKCAAAAAEVRAGAPSSVLVIPLLLDVASSSSIRVFASAAAAALPAKLEGDFVLVNNAGFVSNVDTPPTADGLEGAMGAMHVGHFYLTHRLLASEGLRARAARVRVVNVASLAHHMCGFSLLARELGVPDEHAPLCLSAKMLSDRPLPPTQPTEPYAESKLSNAIAVDLGWVETSIAPFMRTDIR
ncbi:hypothetical protein T492DRAFT_858773 [Pavlovales sp. CCMP2436]|nr:hypothetical protein T492DRAFT_858773 [Pavlovales sp. CCMP2436]